MVGPFRNGEDVRRDFISPLSSIEVDGSHCVDGVALIRIHSNTEQAGVRIDEFLVVSPAEIEEDGRIIEIGQVGHILTTVELGGIHLSYKVLLVFLGLLCFEDLDLDLSSSCFLYEPLSEL
jgi:hypothetical protein